MYNDNILNYINHANKIVPRNSADLGGSVRCMPDQDQEIAASTQEYIYTVFSFQRK